MVEVHPRCRQNNVFILLFIYVLLFIFVQVLFLLAVSLLAVFLVVVVVFLLTVFLPAVFLLAVFFLAIFFLAVFFLTIFLLPFQLDNEPFDLGITVEGPNVGNMNEGKGMSSLSLDPSLMLAFRPRFLGIFTTVMD
jgi:hypothetical protein